MSKWIFLKYSNNTNFHSVQLQNILTYKDIYIYIFLIFFSFGFAQS